jgi:UDP-N-acetylmuramate: L-alanyl-gamma-D-glutamyl-meso-diaminopimelate ligase
LYELSREKLRVVVAGTHGKSTTAGWLGHMLRNIDDSSFMVGGVLKNYDANFYSGDGHYIVFEGDEYKSLYNDPTPKMHYYKGDVLVLTNLEYDHPDVYANLEEIKGEFRELLANVPDDGIIIYNADNQNLADVVYREPGRSFTFGLHNSAHMKVREVNHGSGGVTEFVVENTLDPDNAKVEVYHTELPGEINIYNALATITALRALGFQPELVNLHLRTYRGIKRRFEVLLEGTVTVVDDYAHHATAVRETLEAAREKYFSLEGRTGKLWAVFEPHMFSRTKATLPELAESFNSADEVLLAPMYGAREA